VGVSLCNYVKPLRDNNQLENGPKVKIKTRSNRPRILIISLLVLGYY
jgi:hypothetical protein